MKRDMKERYDLAELRDIVHDLRGEGGCPWDRAQTYESLAPCLGDESGEVQQAVRNGDRANLCEELGDVLLLILLYSDMAEEEGAFSLDDVITGIARKMVRRHPNVFGDAVTETPEEALALWKEIKAKEKAGLLK